MQLYAVFVGIGLKTFCKCKLKIKSFQWEGSPDKPRAFIKGKTLLPWLWEVGWEWARLIPREYCHRHGAVIITNCQTWPGSKHQQQVFTGARKLETSRRYLIQQPLVINIRRKPVASNLLWLHGNLTTLSFCKEILPGQRIIIANYS